MEEEFEDIPLVNCSYRCRMQSDYPKIVEFQLETKKDGNWVHTCFDDPEIDKELRVKIINHKSRSISINMEHSIHGTVCKDMRIKKLGKEKSVTMNFEFGDLPAHHEIYFCWNTRFKKGRATRVSNAFSIYFYHDGKSSPGFLPFSPVFDLN